MKSDDLWRYIDTERAGLADMLDGLTAEQWSTPSLCKSWTVRDVAVHVTQSHATVHELLVGLLRSGFRFNKTAHRMATEDTRTPEQITAALRGMVGSRRRPPGTSEVDPLIDVLVHGQDIAIPLGIDRPMPAAAALAAAERFWALISPRRRDRTISSLVVRFPKFRGIHFAATDAPFDVGEGQLVSGPIRNIVLVLAGRRTGLAGLSGGVDAIAEALGT